MKVRVLPEARVVVSGLTYSTAVAAPRHDVKLVAAVVRAPLEAVTVTDPTRTAVTVPLVAVPLTTTMVLGRPVTVSAGTPVWVNVIVPL